MNISLYYVQNISRIDTPWFRTAEHPQGSIEEQAAYFATKKVKDIESSFYPPHYHNVIKFDSEDLTLTTNVNYLSLSYGNKTYYYFIDSIEYVKEGLLALSVTMDVIQTYMFNIYISNGIIERKFIDRYLYDSVNQVWNINRDYIRENISRNEFEYYYHYIVNSDVSKWTIIYTRGNFLQNKNSTMNVNYVHANGTNYSEIPNNTCIYIPVFASFQPAYYTGKAWMADDNFTPVEDVSDVDCGCSKISIWMPTRNDIVDGFVCPIDCLDGVSFTNTNTGTRMNMDITKVTPVKVHLTIGLTFEEVDLIYGTFYKDNRSIVKTSFSTNVKVLENSHSFNFIRNSYLATGFNANYLPQMLDDNYIRYTFGSIVNKTTIPLYYLKRDTVYARYGFNLNDGTRFYYLTDKSTEYKDKYNTITTDTNILKLDLKNDPWEKYVAANRGRWLAATANTVADLYTQGMFTSIKRSYINSDMNSLLSNPNNFDKRFKTQQVLRKKPAQEYRRLSEASELNQAESVSNAVKSTNNLVSQAIEDYNIRGIPPTPKQTGSLSGVIGREAFIMHYVERVNDYLQCANYFHRNGYLVNNYVNSISNIFNYVQNRYYFNILKMENPNVHLHDVIEDEDTITLVAERLTDGLRLWNVKSTGVTMGDFQYDNVELSALEG